jgi:uncharacterized protein YdaU (DUF1376 family)
VTTEKKTDMWMPLWIGAYLADTMKLTTLQHGAYLQLLIAYWRERKPLADIDDELRSITKLERAEWKRNRPVLAQFFRVGDGVWWHKRVEAEIAIADGKLDASAAGGGARWGSASDAGARGRNLRSKRLAEAREKGTHTAHEWEGMKAFHGMCCVRCGASGEMVKDHIQPIYQGGSDAIDNIQPLCRRCNASKGPEAIDHRKDGWRNAIEEGIKRLLNAFPTPSPTPLPSGDSEANASAAGAAAGAVDNPVKNAAELTKAELWRAGKSLLLEGGMPKDQCGSFVGKLVKDYGDELVIDAVRSAVVAQPADAATYLKATCMRLKGERKDAPPPATVIEIGLKAHAATQQHLADHVMTPEEEASAAAARAAFVAKHPKGAKAPEPEGQPQ